MEQPRFLAHIDGAREQTVLEHLQGTARLCEAFAKAFGAGEQGRLAGLAHDLGKYSAAFQRRLQGGPVVDHATAGAAECWRMGQPFAAFAVVGHHGGLPAGGAQDDAPDKPTLLGRLNRAEKGKLAPCDRWKQELTLPAAAPPVLPPSYPEQMFFTRMLYSCLVDADFLDTEAFMAAGPVERGGGEPIPVLEQKLLGYIDGWSSPKDPLNEQRCAILQQCLRQGEAQRPGLFTLTVPTGGGKTVASLAFALRHARAHGLRRVVYVIPYTSIIEQNAGEFRKILGAQNVLEHHSGMLYDIKGEATPQEIRLARATENWELPVVVTTAVQFFESLYSNRPSRCRKLHNLAGSVVIFDEAQMLPLPYLRPCVFAIAQLVKYYGVSALLCTATQPALAPLFREFLPGGPPVELCPPGTYQEALFRRVTFRQAGRLGWEALAGELGGCRQALCIVNSRKNAQTLYQLLPKEGRFHLSTLMYPAHRKAVLEEVRERLAAGLPCRVVSTSLMEAGVDVDFPTVYREEAGLDSLLQAAGRCNRNRKRAAEDSIVTVFRAEAPPPRIFAQPIEAGREALRRFAQPDSPEAIHSYFAQLLEIKGPQAQDREGILPLMEGDRAFMPFPTVAERFRLIDNDTHTVYIPAGEGAALVKRLQAGERSRQLLRELGQYGVAVYQEHFRILERAGVLQLLEDGSAILQKPALYTAETGLPLEAAGGQAEFV